MELVKKKPADGGKRKKRITVRNIKHDELNILSNIVTWNINQKIAIINSGVSKLQFEELKLETGLDYETLAHILGVTKATLHSKKGDEKLNNSVSEKLLWLAEIYAYGYEVFGDKERFNHWLTHPVRSTGGIPPLQLLNTVYGMEEVMRLIGRIDYGVYS